MTLISHFALFHFMWRSAKLAKHQMLVFVKNASSVLREGMSSEVQLKPSVVRAGRMVILVILREYRGPLPGFQ